MVIQRFLKLKAWKQAERIVIGGGFSGRRVGELAIGRASVILKAEKIKLDIAIIRNNPDEAGLLGAIQLAPPWIFKAHDGVLAVDIGGTNIRAGIVQLSLKRAADLSKAKIFKYELWRHGDEKLARDDAVEELIKMLERLIRIVAKEEGYSLHPLSASAVPVRSKPMASSIAARKICLATGKAAASACPPPWSRRFPKSASSRLQSSCTMTRWCRGSAKSPRCRTSNDGAFSRSGQDSETRFLPTGIAISPAIPRHW